MKKEIFVLIILLVLTMFVFGCTAKEDVIDNTDASTVSDNSVGEQQTNNVAANKENEKSNSGSSLSELLSGKTVKYTAEYQATFEGKTQTWIQVYDLPDFVTIMRGPGSETRMIFKDSTAYSCNNMEEEWMCLKLPQVETNTNDKLESDVQDGAVKPVYVGTCSRAGLTGEKYTITSEGTESSVCYTKKGILLEMESKDMTMYATKVSESVDSGLFVLPVEPQDFSNMFPGGIPEGSE
jgi:hypothetical protein